MDISTDVQTHGESHADYDNQASPTVRPADTADPIAAVMQQKLAPVEGGTTRDDLLQYIKDVSAMLPGPGLLLVKVKNLMDQLALERAGNPLGDPNNWDIRADRDRQVVEWVYTGPEAQPWLLARSTPNFADRRRLNAILKILEDRGTKGLEEWLFGNVWMRDGEWTREALDKAIREAGL